MARVATIHLILILVFGATSYAQGVSVDSSLIQEVHKEVQKRIQQDSELCSVRGYKLLPIYRFVYMGDITQGYDRNQLSLLIGQTQKPEALVLVTDSSWKLIAFTVVGGRDYSAMHTCNSICRYYGGDLRPFVTLFRSQKFEYIAAMSFGLINSGNEYWAIRKGNHPPIIFFSWVDGLERHSFKHYVRCCSSTAKKAFDMVHSKPESMRELIDKIKKRKKAKH